MYLAVQTQLYDDMAAGISDHQEFLEALRNHDGEAGARIMRNHLQVAANAVLVRLLSEKGDEKNLRLP